MHSPDDERVCVCIAAYNAESTIVRAILSALQQPTVSEVIVVDDASTDATAAVARQCDDGSGRLSVIVLERNGGPSVARNRALSLSRADIFCVLDADDYLLPGRIGRLLMAGSRNWDLLADDILIVPEHLPSPPADAMPDEPVRAPCDLDLRTFILGNVSSPRRPRAELGFLKPLMRRHFLEAHSLAYDPRLRLGEDYALYVRALMAGAKLEVVGFCGYIAVERSNSLSSKHSAADLAALVAFDEACREASGLSEADRAAFVEHQRATTDKWALAKTIQIRREQGIGPALHFLTRQARSTPYAVSRILHARFIRLCRYFWSVEDMQKPRRLIGRTITPG